MAGDFDDRRYGGDYEPGLDDEPAERPWQPERSPGKMSLVQRRYGRMHRAAASTAEVTPDPLRIDAAGQSVGQGLPPELRAELEQAIGADLSGVRVHTDGASGEAAQSIQAKAYTTGNDIFFAPSTYDPDSGDGRRLIAHEVAHTVQQGGATTGAASSPQAKLDVSQPGDALEVEADSFADAFASGRAAPVRQASGAVLARTPSDAPAGPDLYRREAEAALDDQPTLAGEELGAARIPKEKVDQAGELVDALVKIHAPRYFRKRDSLNASGAHAAGSYVYHCARTAAKNVVDAKGYLDTHPAIGFQAHAIRQKAAQVEKKLKQAALTIPPKMGIAWFGGAPVPGNQHEPQADAETAFRLPMQDSNAAMQVADRVKMRLREAGGDPDATAQNAVAQIILEAGLSEPQKRFVFHALDELGIYDKVKAGSVRTGATNTLGTRSIEKERGAALDAIGGVPATVDGVFQRLEEAKEATVATEHERAIELVQLAQQAIRNFGGNYDRVMEAGDFGGLGRGQLEAARSSWQIAEKIISYARIYNASDPPSPGNARLCDRVIAEVAVHRQALELLAGEIEASEAADLHALDTGSWLGPLILGAVPAGLATGALAAELVPVVGGVAAAEAGLLAEAALSLPAWALASPGAALAIVEALGWMGMEAIDQGPIEFIKSLNTWEGANQTLVEVFVLHTSHGGGGGGRPAPASRRNPAGAQKPAAAPAPGRAAEVKEQLEDLSDRIKASVKALGEWLPQKARVAQGAGGHQQAIEGPSLAEHTQHQMSAAKERRRVQRGLPATPAARARTYHPPRPGSSVDDAREQIHRDAREQYPVEPAMPVAQKQARHEKQAQYFETIERQADAEVRSLEGRLRHAPTAERAGIEEELAAARVLLEAARDRPAIPGVWSAAGTERKGRVLYKPLDELGRPQGIEAEITPDMIGAGTDASPSIKPPGWKGHGREHNQARGHLLANDLGGSGDMAENLVTLEQSWANTPEMKRFEQHVRGAVAVGETVRYEVTPIYKGNAEIPMGVSLQARGERGFSMEVTILNPQGMDRPYKAPKLELPNGTKPVLTGKDR